MPTDDNSQISLILIISAVLLLIFLVAVSFRVLKRLKRMEAILAGGVGGREKMDADESPQESGAGGTFEAFLNEDPARLEMSKSERFAAYRRWRQENGLNWSKG